MKYIMLIALVSTLGCSVEVETSQRPLTRPFVSVTMAFGSMGYEKPPVSPQEGCEEGCGCNGTGEERSGDGLAVVACRCPETCECKASNLSEAPNSSPATKQETSTPAADPPLVPLAPKQAGNRIECVGGQCYLVEPGGKRYRIIRR